MKLNINVLLFQFYIRGGAMVYGKGIIIIRGLENACKKLQERLFAKVDYHPPEHLDGTYIGTPISASESELVKVKPNDFATELTRNIVQKYHLDVEQIHVDGSVIVLRSDITTSQKIARKARDMNRKLYGESLEIETRKVQDEPRKLPDDNSEQYWDNLNVSRMTE